MSDRLLVLVRHGQSEWNLKNLFTGWKDVDLTEAGIAEARAAGAKLKAQGLSFDVAYTSALAPTLSLVGILTMAGYFQLFAEPYVMTRGGPLQSTTSVLYFMYDEGFKWWNLGSASAVAFVLFLLMFAVTMVQFRVARRLAR